MTTMVMTEEAPLTMSLDLAGVQKEAQLPEVVADDPVRNKAREAVSKLVTINPSQYEAAKTMIDTAGSSIMAKSASGSEMLNARIGSLMKDAEGGSEVATALVELRDEVSALDPSGINFNKSTISQLLAKIPFVGTSMRAYFNRFETGQGAIAAIMDSLKSGKATLQNDNRILGNDQKNYRATTVELQKQIAYLEAVAEELGIQLNNVTDEKHRGFLENEILFPLRQRITDLLQRLQVNQQGVISAELLIRNNRELIRGVDRALNVTIEALSIAVATALALNNQKLVLDAVQGLNETTNRLIQGNAERLATQGVDIQKQASSTMIDAEALKQSFATLAGALDEIARYRRDALPQMQQTINEIRTSAEEADKRIIEMEKGTAAAEEIGLSLEFVDEAA